MGGELNSTQGLVSLPATSSNAAKQEKIASVKKRQATRHPSSKNAGSGCQMKAGHPTSASWVIDYNAGCGLKSCLNQPIGSDDWNCLCQMKAGHPTSVSWGIDHNAGCGLKSCLNPPIGSDNWSCLCQMKAGHPTSASWVIDYNAGCGLKSCLNPPIGSDD